MELLELWSQYRPQWSPLTYGIVCILVFILIYREAYRNQWNKKQGIMAFILLIYLVMVFSSTVFSREPTSGVHDRLEVFWSYKWGIEVYGFELIKEVLLNILMLMPVGVIMPIIKGKSAFVFTIIIGFLCSFSIESLQYILKCGLAEIDDIFHNTMGVLIGYGVYKIISVVSLKLKRVTDV